MRCRPPTDGLEPFRHIGVTQLSVHLPEPICSNLGNVAELLLSHQALALGAFAVSNLLTQLVADSIQLGGARLYGVLQT